MAHRVSPGRTIYTIPGPGAARPLDSGPGVGPWAAAWLAELRRTRAAINTTRMRKGEIGCIAVSPSVISSLINIRHAACCKLGGRRVLGSLGQQRCGVMEHATAHDPPHP